MPQLIVECSDPGVVVSLAEEFETILRQIDFARAQELQRQLGDLAHELGSAFEAIWRGFRIEMPNDGDRPLTFGTRDAVDDDQLKQLLDQATERGIAKFTMRDTLPRGRAEDEGPGSWLGRPTAPEALGGYLPSLAVCRRAVNQPISGKMQA